MAHLVLLGDSIFDNAMYVSEGGAVIQQLSRRLKPDWIASLLAVDGSITTDVPGQLEQVPESATHLLISIGGNDALQHERVLFHRVDSVAGALWHLGIIQRDFSKRYAQILDAAQETGLPIAVCTIYDPDITDREKRRLSILALNFFNDVIIRQATLRRIPLIDLRSICVHPRDFSHEIEPSAEGAAKISKAIISLLMRWDHPHEHSLIIGGPNDI